MLILAGCGGSSEPKVQTQVVRGHGFSFSAPAGWHIQHSSQGSAASQGSELVQVSTFPLVRRYTASLFARVAHELDLRMKTIAQETGGKVTGRQTVTAGGREVAPLRRDGRRPRRPVHVRADRKREYQLLCRYRTSSTDAFCSDLLTSFRPA